jgi:hypothetical protein
VGHRQSTASVKEKKREKQGNGWKGVQKQNKKHRSKKEERSKKGKVEYRTEIKE